MSKQVDLLELEKCIVSRLWYTSIIVHRTEIEQRRNHRDVKHLRKLIETCAEQGLQEHRWIAHKLLSQIEDSEETRKNLVHEEFDNTLKLLDTRIPGNVKEELQRLFIAVKSAQQNNDISSPQLCDESLQCLESNLLENPVLLHWIIDGLLCIWLPTHFSQTDSALQDVYFSSIKNLLKKSLLHENNENAEKFLGKESLGLLLSILSKLELTDTKEDELLAWLFPTLLKSCNSDDIELALYSRKNLKFFKAWHEFLDDNYARCQPASNLENALKICSIVFDFHGETGTVFNANEIFKRTLRRQSHWLTDIFDICYVLLINERYNEVEKIFCSPVLKNLWLILLFKLLKDCPNIQVSPSSETLPKTSSICSALRFVLNKSQSTSSKDPTLKKLQKTLENHLSVLDWIIERKKNATIPNFQITNLQYPNFTIKQALNLLQSHSILGVLKMTTNIHEMNNEEITSLLKDREETKSIFQAYRAMLSALRAILLCDSYNSKYLEVSERFDDMEKCLGSLFPLDLRLEVIENIFSMLFLRYEDFVECESASDGGEEDCTEKSRDSGPAETGFLCNKYATRETLNRLKRSVAALEIECTDQIRDKIEPIEITSRVQKSIASVSKALADATWRLELLTSAIFIERQGIPDLHSRKPLISENETIFIDDRLNNSSHSKNKTIFYKPNESSSDESELMKSDLDGSSEAGSQGNGTGSGGKRRKRSRIHSSVAELSTITRESKQRERTLNSMLASKESLVLQCLWKSDYDRASQVIEMFDLKNSRLDGEILFSRAMRSFRKDMRAQWINSDTVDSTDFASKHSTLENIRKAVQGGFYSSRTTSQVETFLAAQESSMKLLNSEGTTSKEIRTLASLDLSLTMSHNHQDSVNLSDVTMKYLQSCKKLSNTRYHDFFNAIHKLLYDYKPELSVKQILCDARLPLSLQEAKEKKEYWSRLSENLENFRESQLEPREELDDSINDESFHPSEKHFKDIISLCENGEHYLPRVHAHLKLLRTILPEDSEFLEPDFSMLKTSLDTYIGDQIFRLNLELEEVETIAGRLRVNLVHSILVNCCPKLLCTNEICQEGSERWGSTVLNKSIGENDLINENLNQCVTEILSELLEVLRKSSSNSTLRHEESKLLMNNEEVQKILGKTRFLATLDLSNLSFGDDTLAFFVNLWNLMMLHTMLEIWSNDPPMDDLRHEISLTAVRYIVGDLGTVSLAALRSKLLGQNSWGPQYFSHTEELNEPAWQDLDVPYDPRVIFALINEYKDSPKIRIYGQKTLNEELNAATIDYLDHYEKISTSSKEETEEFLNLPELVNRYENLILKKPNSPEQISISEHLSITKNNRKVSFTPLRYSYDIKFEYTEEKSCELRKVSMSKEEEISWQRRIVKPSLLQYLEGHCWLLSYLVQRIHEESPTILDNNCRTAALENLLKSSWANSLKSLYEDNQTVAGLRKIVITNDFWNCMETLLASGETNKCLEILNALPDSLLSSNVEVQRFKDKILAHLATISPNLSIAETLQYIYQIKDEQILAQLILTNANDFPVKVCQEALKHVLSHIEKEKLPIHCKSRMNEILCRVTVFHKMLPYCTKSESVEENSWHDMMHRTKKTNPVMIVKSLIDAKQYELCLEWLEYQAVSSEIHCLITQDLLIGLLTNEDEDFKHAFKLLRALPIKKSINLCKGVIGKLESIGALRCIVEYLLENSVGSESAKYRRCLLGADVLEQLDGKERKSYAHLMEQPLLMLEQLLMNCRLDSLQRILSAIREKPTVIDGYTEEFDKTVRFYASKSLDFRVAVQSDGTEKIKDSSVSSNMSQSGDFVMPLNIPTKDEWVPNDKARECSCCRVVIFSMFNRRHHCRRCGRVVCATCSPQRMRLPSYPNSVAVRVCNDCKRQTLQQLQAVPSTPSSEAFDCWRLTIDEAHNKTLREEFSFENAPNISLCLAILNLHSDNETYSNFLLDRCDEMKCLLRPDSKGRVNPEVDHALIIKMIRSLLVAAKVKCAELGLNTGLTHCDRFLSQVDLITTLVNSDCSSLIPRIDKDDHLDDHTLRRLRYLLTEKEQWILALDVSTKTGLDTQGVWAAWGTACLKVGYYERAREKFLHCLDKVLREDSEDWVMLSYPGESNIDRNKRLGDSPEDNRSKKTNSKSQEGLKNRPSKDPPLLTEILQILEKTNFNDSCAHQSVKSRPAGPQEILNTLSSLKAISQGQYSIAQASGTKNFRYQESLYYLLMYGSFNSILEFFVRHGEYDKCLSYILENDVEPELFMNSVFLRCLRNGCMANLFETMRAKDSSLLAFKKYLMYTCHSLEKKQLLNTLHQLQLFMKDYVRAAMTCIRFYVTDATTYEDLCSRTHLLIEAQKHLESELQLENFGKKRRKSVSSSMSGQNSLTLEMDPAEIDRHMNTISRQMEIAKFLGHREQEGKSVSEFMSKLSYMETEASSSHAVPTLFGNQEEKTHLAVLAILCGRDVEEGFGIAFRIMQDYNLRPQKIYSLVGHMLALDKKINSIEQLIKCCRSSGAPNSNAISDRVLAHCVKLLLDRSRADSNPSPKDQIDTLIRIITDVELKIESYIESRQLKAAYLLAVKHSRAQDIRKILKEADRLGQQAIKSICTKWLQQLPYN